MNTSLESIEIHFLKWINILSDEFQLKNFEEVGEKNQVWLKIADLAQFKALAFESEFFNNTNVESYVKMLEEIWQSQRDVNIFEPFNNYLKEEFNDDFNFVTDF